MLHTEAIEPNTLSLLKRLSALPELKSFSLVGGTALALKYGHRKSIDLDFFNHENFDIKQIVDVLEFFALYKILKLTLCNIYIH